MSLDPNKKPKESNRARKHRRPQKPNDGILNYEFESWRDIFSFANEESILGASHYVWRGTRGDIHGKYQSRELLPSFDRLFYNRHTTTSKDDNRENKQVFIEKKLIVHLEKFKLASRGRLASVQTDNNLSENDWWAIGQHYGLVTPLLDWTKSIYVALFFAFEKHIDCKENEQDLTKRYLYGINTESVTKKSEDIKANIIKSSCSNNSRPDIIEFFNPPCGNSRLVSQNSLFSRCTAGKDIETWIREKFEKKMEKNKSHFIKIGIKQKTNKEREDCLTALNRMNINFLSLFPDIEGSSKHCNIAINMKDYSFLI